jgi:HEAT repeat protein
MKASGDPLTPSHPPTMRKRGQIALVVLLVAIVAGITWLALRVREPVFQGKRLSMWLRSYSPDGDSPEVDDAVRTIGTNAIPTLLGNLQSKDSTLRQALTALGVPYTPAETRHMRAEKGFSALGADASNAVPALIEIYEQNFSPTARRAAANALVEIGPASKQAIPALIKSTASTNSDVCAFALYTLGRMALESELVDPVLIKALHDPARQVRYDAVFGLANLAFMGGDAKPAVPALIEALQDSYIGVRGGAAHALGHIHSDPGIVVPALIKSLHDPDTSVRIYAAAALGESGTNGRPAVAALGELLSETNQDVSNAAADALKKIDPEAAARAGVK